MVVNLARARPGTIKKVPAHGGHAGDEKRGVSEDRGWLLLGS